MSLENLKEYARRCANEPELRARAKEIGLENLDGQMRHAGGLGLDWTMEDMAALRNEITDADGNLGELSEEEMERIAGGAVSVTGVLTVVATVAAGVATAGAIAAAGAAVGAGVAAAGQGGW